MCVNLSKFPLVELEDGKKKVLFNYGIVIENRDFEPINDLVEDWKYAIYGEVPKKHPYFNKAVREYGIKKILKYVNVPCGHCEECLKSKARGWAFRILKEAEQFNECYFITLTYDDANLHFSDCGIPTLRKEDLSEFNKKLKTYLKRKKLDSSFRFYGIGEYGGQFLRPHLHVMYFGLPIYDLEFNYAKNGIAHFRSKFLESVWTAGIVDIEMIHIGNACYISRYCDKKLNRVQEEKDALLKSGIVPEFSNMSRRPGIGAAALDIIKSNIEHGIYSLSTNGNDFSIPIYYSKKIKDILDPNILKDMEDRNNLLVKIKFANDLTLSDILSTDLQDYYLSEDIYKKSLKKSRDLI